MHHAVRSDHNDRGHAHGLEPDAGPDADAHPDSQPEPDPDSGGRSVSQDGPPVVVPPGFEGEVEPDTTMEGIHPVPAEPAMQAAIDAALAGLKNDEKGAIVAYGDLEGARLAVMARLSGNWSFVCIADRDWKGNLRAGAQVRKAW